MNMASKMKRTSIDLPKRVAWVHRENCKEFVKDCVQAIRNSACAGEMSVRMTHVFPYDNTGSMVKEDALWVKQALEKKGFEVSIANENFHATDQIHFDISWGNADELASLNHLNLLLKVVLAIFGIGGMALCIGFLVSDIREIIFG